MTTESDAVLATIVDNWGNGGYGGATPKIQSTTDISVDRWAALDAVIVLHDTLDELHPPVNDKFVNKEYTMDIRVTSITSEDQLKLLVEETEYLLNNTAITGFTSVRVYRKNRGSSDRGRKVYRNDVSINLTATMSSSAVAPDGGTFAGPTTLSSLVFSDGGSTVDIIRDEDNMSTDDAAALATQQSIKAYVDATVNSIIGDLGMYGSGNAAYVPCVYSETSEAGKIESAYHNLTNVDDTDQILMFDLPIPHLKGAMKLYITELVVGLKDADEDDYITTIAVYGHTDHASTTVVHTDATDKKAAAAVTYNIGATDMSGYLSTKIAIVLVCTNAGEVDIAWVRMKCYYAT